MCLPAALQLQHFRLEIRSFHFSCDKLTKTVLIPMLTYSKKMIKCDPAFKAVRASLLAKNEFEQRQIRAKSDAAWDLKQSIAQSREDRAGGRKSSPRGNAKAVEKISVREGMEFVITN